MYALSRAATDLRMAGGNNDGLWDEAGGPGLHRPAAILRIEATLRTGLSKSDEAHFLAQILAKKQAEWGDTPVTTLYPSALPQFIPFVTRKALDLARFARHPTEVTEGFIEASGSVNGANIADREVFFQRFEPHATVPATGKVIVVSPGLQETGRNFLEQIDQMNALGHTVITLDHQWSGYSKGGSPGAMDRLFGAARDVAAVAAQVAAWVESEPKLRGGEVLLFGNGVGGTAVLAATTMNDADRVKLKGPPMPKGLKMVLQAPFLKAVSSLSNTLLRVGAQIPGLRDLHLPGVGAPANAGDPDAGGKTQQEVLLEGSLPQPSALFAADDDLATLKHAISGGTTPGGSALIVHARGDEVAAFSGSEWL
ncbi:MAG TPA: alpha/beta hydrolase, partial [Myxococcota bacterium]|nr:alpha/beta hydrolase [Myxococcota bacterium]